MDVGQFQEGTLLAGGGFGDNLGHRQVGAESVPGVRSVNVTMTFDPQWGMDMMSDEARLELGFM